MSQKHKTTGLIHMVTSEGFWSRLNTR